MASNITLRIPKGSRLTYEEGDNNFRDILKLYRFTEDTVVAGGTADALTVTSTNEPVDTLVDNMFIGFQTTAANTAINPTLDVDGTGAIVIQQADGSAINPGGLVANVFYVARYNQSTSSYRLFGAAPPALTVSGGPVPTSIPDVLDLSFSTNFVPTSTPDGANIIINPEENIVFNSDFSDFQSYGLVWEDFQQTSGGDVTGDLKQSNNVLDLRSIGFNNDTMDYRNAIVLELNANNIPNLDILPSIRLYRQDVRGEDQTRFDFMYWSDGSAYFDDRAHLEATDFQGFYWYTQGSAEGSENARIGVDTDSFEIITRNIVEDFSERVPALTIAQFSQEQFGEFNTNIYVGNQNPEGSVAAPRASIYVRDSNTDGVSSVFFKINGVGNTGWSELLNQGIGIFNIGNPVPIVANAFDLSFSSNFLLTNAGSNVANIQLNPDTQILLNDGVTIGFGTTVNHTIGYEGSFNSLLISGTGIGEGLPVYTLRYTNDTTLDNYVSAVRLGEDDPESTINGNRGDLYIRSSDTDGESSLFVKVDGADGTNTGWDNLLPNNDFVALERIDDRLRLTARDGTVSQEIVTDLSRQIGPLGTDPGNILLDNINSRYLVFASTTDGIITLSAANDLADGGIFLLDLSQVGANRTFNLADTTESEFEDGTTSITIPANSKILFGCYLPVPTSPKSPTNKLTFRGIAFSNSNIDQGLPPSNATAFLSVSSGFPAEIAGNGSSRSLPFSALADAFTTLSTLPGSIHKQIVVDEENTIASFNNNATGGGNVPNLRFIAPAVTLNDFRSIGHACNAQIRRIDIVVAGNGCVIGQDDTVIVDVVSGLPAASPSITFDNTVTITNFKLKAGTITSDVSLTFAGLPANAGGRIEIDRYEGNIVTALNTLPDVALDLHGWIGDTIIQSSSNGTVYGITIEDNGDRTATAYNAPP